MTATTVTAPATASQRTRAVVAATIGNALEWFDFAVYGFFAVTMAKVFFPAGNETVSLLVMLATFGVTFFLRPLGAIVIGNFADRHGRKSALTLTIALMTLGTAVIAFAPTFQMVGILAPIIIVIARMIQGFSAGGEFGSATAFLAEQNPARRGFFASWQFASQGMTTMLATGFGAALSASLAPDQLESWGWRVPFLFGLLIGPVAYYIRKHLEETGEFQATAVSATPMRDVLTGSTRAQLFVAFGAVVLCTVATYTMSVFMQVFATRTLGLPMAGVFSAGLLLGAIQAILVPVFGALSDRYGRTSIQLVGAVAIAVLIYPAFSLLVANPSVQTLLLVQGVMAVFVACYLGPLPALMSELFPTRLRTSGLSLAYSFGVAIFGGFAPFIGTALVDFTGSRVAPSFYLMLAAIVSIAALVGARRLGFK